MIKKILLVCSFWFLVMGSAVAQKGWSLYFGLGTTYYYGEMNDRLITHNKLLRLGGQIGLQYDFNRTVGFRFNYLHGRVAGADSLAKDQDRINRNLSFQSDNDELSGQLVIRPFTIGRVTPYVFAGLGGLHYKPKAELNGDLVELQPLGTEGQFIPDSGYVDPYDLWTMSVPLGVGVNIRLNERWDIGIEAGYHKLFTDFLDDVSTIYPDKSKLLLTPDGGAAVALSDRDLVRPQEAFTARGNDEKDDSMMHVFITATYHFKKRASYAGKARGKRAPSCFDW